MKIVIFGLSVSSAWGNGHATLLRGLFRALHGQGHEVHFLEHDVPYYAAHRDAASLPYAHLHLYSDWQSILPAARELTANCDVAMVTSYCPDGAAACDLVLDSRAACKVFYDMDTPVTLLRLEQGEKVSYLPAYGLRGFDLVLSYTGGEALDRLRHVLGAENVSTLYGWVDPEVHYSTPLNSFFAADLSYLGTYSADRQDTLVKLMIEPARRLAGKQFLVAGALYPSTEGWPANIRHFEHVAPPEHAAFYSSSPVTLNVTRASMAAMGYCPSGRLFEAAACGTAVLSDWWTGLDSFFKPGEEILLAGSTAEAESLLAEDREFFERIGARAKQRALDCHTATIRVRQLVQLLGASTRTGSNTEQICAV
jgi:spore maturation protein CgeB